MDSPGQKLLFAVADTATKTRDETSSTFIGNMKLPVHRWFRFSAGFSAAWVESVIAEARKAGAVRVFDPFAGSGTTLIAAEDAGVESSGLEAHPFLFRIAGAKLLRRTDPAAYAQFIRRVLQSAEQREADISHYPALIRKCYDDDSLRQLDVLRRAIEALRDGSSAAELGWLTLVGILRGSSHAGTATWQYVLPKKSKKSPSPPWIAFDALAEIMKQDMRLSQKVEGPPARFFLDDARLCENIPAGFSNLVITSPPYPNNYDYADATRLEMSFLGEVRGWGDLQGIVRRHLVRSCSQHVPEKAVNLEEVLRSDELGPIRAAISTVCEKLAEVRLTKGGRKTYHLMVACYFLDLARVWRTLRRVCDSPSTVCFVVGDSAPYGVYVPVVEWLGELAMAAGFHSFEFERTRDRNVKWKNRKHRVPLCEGRLWVRG